MWGNPKISILTAMLPIFPYIGTLDGIINAPPLEPRGGMGRTCRTGLGGDGRGWDGVVGWGGKRGGELLMI